MLQRLRPPPVRLVSLAHLTDGLSSDPESASYFRWLKSVFQHSLDLLRVGNRHAICHSDGPSSICYAVPNIVSAGHPFEVAIVIMRSGAVLVVDGRSIKGGRANERHRHGTMNEHLTLIPSVRKLDLKVPIFGLPLRQNARGIAHTPKVGHLEHFLKFWQRANQRSPNFFFHQGLM